MTTALQIINDALTTIGVLGAGQPVNPEDSSVGFDRLNMMIDAWALQFGYAISVDEQIYAMPGGQTTVTIGAGAQINVTRPVRLEDGVFMRKSNQDYAIDVVGREVYEAIQNKSIQAFVPQFVYYDDSPGVGVMYFYPVMSAAGELHVPLQAQVAQFATLNTNITIGQGYRRALGLSLAEELAPIYGKEVPPTLMRQAASSRRILRRANVSAPKTGDAQPIRWNIYSNR